MPIDYRVPVYDIEWETLIAPEHWRTYKCVLDRALRENVPFAFGGGFSVGIYTGKARYTKDLDLYILPEHRNRVVGYDHQNAGSMDYYETKPYNRNWIYRAHTSEVIVDSIWAMANQRARSRPGLAGPGSARFACSIGNFE